MNTDTETTPLKATTDFTIWLAFVVTISATVVLIATGTVDLLQGNFNGLYQLAGSLVTLGIHYAIRKM